MLHAQGDYCIFQSGGHAAVHLAIRWHDVADVTRHKKVAWRALSDQFGHDARVSAGNEHGPWRLRSRQFLEQLFLLREDFFTKMNKAIDDMFQRYVGAVRVAGCAGRRSRMLFISVSHVFILSDGLMSILHVCLTRAGCDHL
ncbi:hypothetical protein F2S73_19525 [Pseudomonas syringae pv. actinidiae]|nr:hypothetical protein [Pseudomonas syringae pv. actinidiae]